MSYRKALDRLRAYEPNRLLQYYYFDGECCCVIAAVSHQFRYMGLRRAHLSSLVKENEWLADALASTGMTLPEALRLQSVSDEFFGTNEDRYLAVDSWLEARVAEEPQS